MNLGEVFVIGGNVLSRHIVPASKKSGRPEVEFFTIVVDRRRGRVRLEIPAYNAYFIFTRTDEGVEIISERDRQAIDPNQEVVDHVHEGVYRKMTQVAASILHSQRP